MWGAASKGASREGSTAAPVGVSRGLQGSRVHPGKRSVVGACMRIPPGGLSEGCSLSCAVLGGLGSSGPLWQSCSSTSGSLPCLPHKSPSISALFPLLLMWLLSYLLVLFLHFLLGFSANAAPKGKIHPKMEEIPLQGVHPWAWGCWAVLGDRG